MRFAVLSDVHGNCPALRKVLQDAKLRGIEDFVIAGDYAISGAWPNECIEVLRSIPKKLIIRGNEERYLENLIGKDQSKWTDGQMQVSYWCYRNVSPENLAYVLGLPQTAELEVSGVTIHVAHSVDAFIRGYELGELSSISVAKRYANAEVTPESLRRDIHEILNGDASFLEKVNALEDGVYVFGHSHVQWSYKVSGRNVLLINPGSCGLPLDAIEGTIPYSILTITESGETAVEEVRIPFDKEGYVEELKQTTQYAEANVWTKVIFRELLTAREHMTFFLQFVNEYAERIGDPVRPFSVKTWEAAYEVWKENVMMTYEDLKDKTLKELLENPILSAVAKDAIRKMDLSKEEYYTWTLQEIADKMGWKNLERGFQKLLAVASKGEYCFKLYDPSECEGNPEKESAHIVFFPSDDIMAKDRPYLFLVPGGGLVNVWNLTEGWPVARTFNELGYNVVILTYQVDIDENALVAMENFARAFEIIAAKKEEFHVDPQKYITCGFSSGGYLVCLWNSEKGYRAYNVAKPSGCFPIYSMTSYRLLRDCVDWDDEQEMEECALETVGCSMEEACNSCFEIPEHVEGFPPTYIVTMDGDNVCNPEHSKMLAKALEAAKIPYQFELGENGWHGFADGIGMSMEGWPERATNWLKTLEG